MFMVDMKTERPSCEVGETSLGLTADRAGAVLNGEEAIVVFRGESVPLQRRAA
jgi:hypothetical protein